MTSHGRNNERLCPRCTDAVENRGHDLIKVRDSTASNSKRDPHARFEFRDKGLAFHFFLEQCVELELTRGGVVLVEMKHSRQAQGHSGNNNADFLSVEELPHSLLDADRASVRSTLPPGRFPYSSCGE